MVDPPLAHARSYEKPVPETFKNMKTRIPILTLAVAAVAVAIQLLPASVATALQFDRAALSLGEWWRIVTGHLTHFSANHLTWDVAVLVALGVACESDSRAHTALTLGVASVAISVAVWFWQPQFEAYRGLSGLDCALFGLFVASLFRQGGQASRIMGSIALLAVGAKCVFEIATGSTAFATGAGYALVPLAHLVGVASGFAAKWGGVMWSRWSEVGRVSCTRRGVGSSTGSAS